MRVGDLVKLGENCFSMFPYGIIVKVISESLVLVRWIGTDHEHLETSNNLELVG
jgi:hypothetical protein